MNVAAVGSRRSMLMKASQRQSRSSRSNRLSFALIFPKRRSSRVVPGMSGFSPADWISHVPRTSKTHRVWPGCVRLTTSRRLPSVTTNSNIARSLTAKIIRRASISSPSPFTLGARPTGSKGLVVEDLATEVVEFFKRRGVEVDPARQRQPGAYHLCFCRSVSKPATPKYGPPSLSDARDDRVLGRGAEWRDSIGACLCMPPGATPLSSPSTIACAANASTSTCSGP
jgi:hypothetical protein